MEALVLFTSHRVEMLKHFEEYAEKFDKIVIEEPRDNLFEKMLKGEIAIEDYVDQLNTAFPLYSQYQCELLRKLYSAGKEIYQIEPYLEILEMIHKAIEKNKLDELPDNEDVRKVREIERKVNKAWIEYQEAFIRKDFDGLVNAMIEFTKADAERFKIRDEMRAREIAKIDGKVLVEAGHIHILLPQYLENYGFKVSTVSLPEMVAKKLGIEFYQNPGNLLTVKFMLGEKVDENEAKIMAARGLIYISLTPKEELLPSDDEPYPHLIRECKLAKIVNKLSYEECKRLFYKIWTRRSSEAKET